MARELLDVDGKSFPKFKENPFLRHTAEVSATGWRPQYANPEGGIAVLSEATGKIHGAAVIYQKEVERSEFVKVYAEGIAAILNLKAAGKKVFMLIYKQLFGKGGIGKTIVLLDWQMLSDDEQKEISKQTLARGIKQCLETQIIARTMTAGAYFINPAFIFNGNRLALIQQYIVKDDEKRSPTIERAKEDEE